MPATCQRDGRRCLPVYVNICRRRNADTSPTLKQCRRQIVEVESTARLQRIFLCEQMSARWRRQNKCDFPEVCGRSTMKLELVYDASATPSGCCRRHDCDVTVLYVDQA